MSDKTAIVVGAGPNGLSAAVALARAGVRVTIREAMDEIGGGTGTGELTLPGFQHDVCSSVHPMGAASPFFRSLPLAEHGLEWVQPSSPLAHPFDDGTAALLERSTAATGETLDVADRSTWSRVMDPFVSRFDPLIVDTLAPLRLPKSPLLMARFGLGAIRSALGFVRSRFDGPRARALFCGAAAHTLEPLETPPTAAFGLMLTITGHAVGWPFARGGSQQISNALATELKQHGGAIMTGAPVHTLDDLPAADAVLLDLTPRQVVAVAGSRLPGRYRRRLERYRYGPGVFKIDWALSEPIPWTAEECRRAGTIHLGGTAEEIAQSSGDAFHGRVPQRPFVLLTQPTLFDPTRAPEGRHIAWAYSHVPHGSTVDLTDAIETQVERFAPGFRDTILARATRTPRQIEQHNANMIGGDINGGVADLRQLFFRPVARLDPYSTPAKDIFICSSSTPPGGAVHGMCGWHAARSALRQLGR